MAIDWSSSPDVYLQMRQLGCDVAAGVAQYSLHEDELTLLQLIGAAAEPESPDPWDHDPLPAVATPRVLYRRGALGLSLLICGATVALRSAEPANALVALLCYFVLAYTMRVVPPANVWPDGPFGDAMRQLHHVNRQRAVLAYFFGPGRFILTSMRDAVSHATGHRVIVLHRHDH